MYKIRIFITFITSVDLFMSQIFIRCSNLNDGKYWRAYTTTFAFGREIPAGKDMTFDLNISFPARPSVLVIIPSTAKITNVRYDFDNSTSTKTRIIFDNEGATIPADAMVRMGVIAIE